MKVAGRRIVVVGLGESGFAAANRLAALGAEVVVTEARSTVVIEQRAATLRARGVEVTAGGHDHGALIGDLAVVSPGIPPHAPVVRALTGAGIEVIGEVELAYRLGEGRDFLAVTGTNGKTTTTSLLAAMLGASGIPSAAAGNIGLPLVDAVFDVPQGGAIATEVSSFQLATIKDFRPRVAVLLNVAEDHTDWHGTVESYLEAKARIVVNQRAEDLFVVNADDEKAWSVTASARSRVVPFSTEGAPEDGTGYRDGWLVHHGERIVAVGDIALPGAAGREDVAAAAGAALSYGVERGAVARAVQAFKPLGHRLAPVAEIDGVSYIDDSKATNPHATLAAVKGLRNVVLIAGGRSKGIDLSVLALTVPPVTAVVALGEAGHEIARVFDGIVSVDVVDSMDQAVRVARHRAIPQGSVLLSPGCASLDMYEGYAQRGAAFVAAVRSLAPDSRYDEQAKEAGDGDH